MNSLSREIRLTFLMVIYESKKKKGKKIYDDDQDFSFCAHCSYCFLIIFFLGSFLMASVFFNSNEDIGICLFLGESGLTGSSFISTRSRSGGSPSCCNTVHIALIFLSEYILSS